jgi:hypothetical protein
MKIKSKIDKYVLEGILILMGFVIVSLVINSYNVLHNLQQPMELTQANLDFMVFAVEVQTVISVVFAVLFGIGFINNNLPESWKEKIKSAINN